MSNIATTISQSRKLIELGLDPKTADMVYLFEDKEYPCVLKEPDYLDGSDTLAWSLFSLLEVMPSNIGDYDLYITKHKYVDGGYGYNVEYNRGFTISVLHKVTSRDLVTAAYEMVCWLLEQGLIKKGENNEH